MLHLNLNKQGDLVDYEVVYNDNFLEQMLEYGKKYSFESSLSL